MHKSYQDINVDSLETLYQPILVKTDKGSRSWEIKKL